MTHLGMMPRPPIRCSHRGLDRWNPHAGREIHQKDSNQSRDTYIHQYWGASAKRWRPIIGEYRCLVIDLSLSDESHAQHDDSSDQNLDEEHRIGVSPWCLEWSMGTSGTQKCRFFGVSIFNPGGVRGSIPMSWLI